MELTKTQKKQRLAMMICSAFAIFFTGYPHVWSIYQPYVMEMAGWTQGQASMCFYLAPCTFVFGNIIGGRMQYKYNPRLTVIIGGGIFAVGILASAFLIVPSPLPIYLTYGVMQGFGQGMLYTAIISTAQKWFPGRTGFASGVVVTANGLCGFFLAPLSRQLLEAGGPKIAFLIIGTAIAVSWILCSVFFFVPDKKWRQEMEAKLLKKVSGNEESAGKTEEPRQYTSAEMMKTKSFYLLLATMLFGLIAYFILSPVSQTYQIEIGIPSAVAVSAVMFGSIVNAGTRLVLPTLSDKVGRIECIKIVLVVSVIAMAVLTLSDSYVVPAAIVVMYGCYGGIMGSFPSFTSSIFGIEHSGENYGYVMFGIVIATFGAPVLIGFVTGQGYGIKTVFAIGMVFAVVSFISLTMLEKNLKNKCSRKNKAVEICE
jgi:OFA family oxalate/formate antiporter-like MFS transporter